MRTPTRVAAWLFLAFQALYSLTSSGNVFRLPDEFEVYFQVESLVDRQCLAVPQALSMTETLVRSDGRVEVRPVLFGKIGRDGQPYAPYGPLAAVLAVPHHLVARAVAALVGVQRAPWPGGRPWLVLVAGLTALATATGAALVVVGFFQACLLLGCGVRRATALSVVLGAGTALWPYGTSFFSEAFVACGLVWAMVCLLSARQESGRRATARVAVACGLMLLTGLVKPTAMVCLPGFLAAVLLDRRTPPRVRFRVALALGLAAAAAGVTHAVYNVHRFGAPLDFGYSWGETVAGGEPKPFSLDGLPRGLLILLASPGKSIFVWAPAVWLAALRIPAAWHRDRAVMAGTVAATVIALVFYGGYFFPEGGYAHGPRHLVPLISLLLLPFAIVREPASSERRPLLAFGLAGFVVALLAVSTSFVQDQTMEQDLHAKVRETYYERVPAAPGRPWNRYRLAYVPFIDTVTSGDWGLGGRPGSGVDFFPLHLARARRLLLDMRVIPGWLPWALPVPWLLLLIGSTCRIARELWVLSTLHSQRDDASRWRSCSASRSTRRRPSR